MRKFMFVGSPDEYDCDEKPVVGKVYPRTHKLYHIDRDIDPIPIELLFDDFPEDWEEIIEPEQKPLHKDTDLGYFAGLVMQSLMSLNYPMDAEFCVNTAKELIKQLDNETDRH